MERRIMNRRTFIKSVGAVVAVISVPITLAKSESKWIRFSEATPKVGQKIIIASQVSVLGMICGGVVKEIPKSGCGSSYTALFTIDDFYVGYNGDNPIGLFYTERGKEILSTRDWIRERELIAPRDYMKFRLGSHYGDYHKETYFWLAVDGEYPKTIPPIPRNPVFDYLESKLSDSVLQGIEADGLFIYAGKNHE